MPDYQIAIAYGSLSISLAAHSNNLPAAIEHAKDVAAILFKHEIREEINKTDLDVYTIMRLDWVLVPREEWQ